MPDCRAYLDDIVIFSKCWEDHISSLKQLFAVLRHANLTVNVNKCIWAKGTIIYLGHEVGQGKIVPLQDKIQAIVDHPVLTNKKSVQRFIGMCAYYRRYCKNFSIVAAPITNLFRKPVKFKWTQECQNTFQKLKGILSTSPVLASPQFDNPFIMHIDASDLRAGAVLSQVGPDGLEHHVYYFSLKFDKAQTSYSVVEKKVLCLILAVKKFETYLSGNQVVIYTDHNPLTFINSMKCKNQRVLRWSLILQEFNIVIRHIPGRQNVIADDLSRGFPIVVP